MLESWEIGKTGGRHGLCEAPEARLGYAVVYCGDFRNSRAVGCSSFVAVERRVGKRLPPDFLRELPIHFAATEH